MKKIWLAVLALVMLAAGAQAEELAEIQFDWTNVLVALVGLVTSLATACAAHVWRKWVQPWLSRHDLTEQAEIVVNAVEALMGRYHGEEKWALALEKMRDRGYYADAQTVIDALKAAWQSLNLTQILAGVKQPEAARIVDGYDVTKLNAEELRVLLNVSGYGLPEEIPEDEAAARTVLLAHLEAVLKERE